MLYRVTKRTPLETGQKYGDIVRDGDLKPAIIQKMLLSGTLSRITTPPLSEIPEWEERAVTLATVGVITIEDLVKADHRKLSKLIKKAPKAVLQWQDEVMQWLNPEKQPDHD